MPEKASNTNDIAFTINKEDLERATKLLEDVRANLGAASVKLMIILQKFQ